MNLLKLTFILVLAASATLLLTQSAHAIDHPWDDRQDDTTTLAHSSTIGGNNPEPVPSRPILERVQKWFRSFYFEIKRYVIGAVEQRTSVDKGDVERSRSRIQPVNK